MEKYNLFLPEYSPNHGVGTLADPLVVVEDLVVKYGDFVAVNKVSFRVEKGEVYCLLGPNGAGKTSTIRAIVGLIKPASGNVRVSGGDPWRDIWVRNKFGYVPEDVVLFESMTPREHILFAASLRKMGKEYEEWINKLVEIFGFAQYLDKPFFSLSRGNRQKLAIILALMHKPELLVLDEPFIGLDYESSMRLREIIKSWPSSGGVLMSTHILEIAEKLCTRVGVIYGGRLVYEDLVENVRNRFASGEVFAELLTELSTRESKVPGFEEG